MICQTSPKITVALCVLALCLSQSVQALNDRDKAILALDKIERAVEENQKKIQRAIADLHSGKISQQEYEDGSEGRAWPKFDAIINQAASIYQENPRDEDAFRAMTYVLTHSPVVYSEDQINSDAATRRMEVMELLLKFHANHKSSWDTFRRLGLPGEAQIEGFKRFYHISKNTDARTNAGLAIAGYYARRATALSINRQQREDYRSRVHRWTKTLQEQFGDHKPEVGRGVDRILAQLI
ncbi:MAG: hypothetical protein OIF34_05065, partial [Porticoccaceae bacterium]|nr:hypothetical protein [Porticoccaceae bacterium]